MTLWLSTKLRPISPMMIFTKTNFSFWILELPPWTTIINRKEKQESSKFVSFLSWFEEATKVVVCNWQVPFAEESLSIVGLVCCCCHLRFRKQLSDSWGDGGQGLNCIFAFLSSTVDKFDFQKSKEGIERSNRSNQLWFIDCKHHKNVCLLLLFILCLLWILVLKIASLP